MVEEQYYRRLLRWYPRSWRAHHGEVLLGIMLDEAEALGRSRPTVGQRRSVFLHGMGNRLGARAALWCAAIGLVLSLVSLVLFRERYREPGQRHDLQLDPPGDDDPPGGCHRGRIPRPGT